jgi:hypothetical protein
MTAMEPPRALGRPRAVRRALSVLAIVIAAVVILGMTSPLVVPRLSILPRPPSHSWYHECNAHGESWRRSGLFWGRSVTDALVACPKHPPTQVP